MGYYTEYKLEIINGDESVDYKKEIGEISGYENVESDPIKWYDNVRDMKTLSNKYPDVLFKLNGNGEENGDIWVSYFKNGKCQYCKAEITFAEFDESKLI